MRKGIIYEDNEVRQLAKDGIVSSLIARWVAENTNIEDFHNEAEDLLNGIPTEELRYFCGRTIRSFTYGSTPLDILTQVEDYHSLATTARNTS